MNRFLLFAATFLLVTACTVQSEVIPTATEITQAVDNPVASSTPEPSPTLTASPTPIPTVTPIPPTPTFTKTPTNTPTLTPTSIPTMTPTSTPIPECVGAFATRLTVGGRAKVINYQLNVREGPGTNYRLVSRLSVNREVTVLGGPQCSDGQLWYHILSDVYRTSAGNQVQVEGWSVEESGNVYYLAPIN